MKIVFTHTDFRIYWPARLNALEEFLKLREIDLEIIEIAGKGSPYSFAKIGSEKPKYWHTLFPDQEMEKVKSATANLALRNMLDKIVPDIVFAGAIAFPSGAAAVRWAVENGKKAVIFDDARLKDTPRTGFVNYIKRIVYAGVDAILCPSPAFNDTYIYFGLENKQIFHSVAVVDNSFWQDSVAPESNIIKKSYFLTVSRQIPKKNLLYLLQAYHYYVKSASDPIDLILVGEGPERFKLENFVSEKHLDKVQFLPFLPQQELKRVYRNALCFILPSLYGETWGLTVNEAMASGLPVLVSNQAGCASTFVKDGVNGFTFSPDNKEELTGILIRMHNMPETELAQMKIKSQEIIAEWGLEKFCSGVYDAIKYVSSKPPKKVSLLTRLILKLWKGRYRPV